MNVVNAILQTKDFLDKNVCHEVKYLKPSETDGRNYNPQYVHPNVFSMFEPTKDRLPNGIVDSVPGIIVKFQKVSGDLGKNQNIINMLLEFTIWQPGTYVSNSDLEHTETQINGEKASLIYEGDISTQFKRDTSGWHELWNFVEFTRNKILEHNIIGDFRLNHDKIEYGPFSQDGAIIDFHPYYMGWLSFVLETKALVAAREFEELL